MLLFRWDLGLAQLPASSRQQSELIGEARG